MSGNSTRLGVSLAQARWSNAAEAIGLISLFVTGAACGSLIVLGRGANRQPWVLLVEAMLLALAALCYAFGLPNAAVAAMVLAMGLENAVFQIDGGAGLGLTYITGALVKVGQIPEVQTRIRGAGIEPVGSDAATFARFVEAENKKWKTFVDRTGIKLSQ